MPACLDAGDRIFTYARLCHPHCYTNPASDHASLVETVARGFPGSSQPEILQGPAPSSGLAAVMPANNTCACWDHHAKAPGKVRHLYQGCCACHESR